MAKKELAKITLYLPDGSSLTYDKVLDIEFYGATRIRFETREGKHISASCFFLIEWA